MREYLILLRGKKSQSQVAKTLEITQQFLSAIERGDRNPSIKLMKRFEKYYNKDMVELFPDIFLETNTTKGSKNTKSA